MHYNVIFTEKGVGLPTVYKVVTKMEFTHDVRPITLGHFIQKKAKECSGEQA